MVFIFSSAHTGQGSRQLPCTLLYTAFFAKEHWALLQPRPQSSTRCAVVNCIPDHSRLLVAQDSVADTATPRATVLRAQRFLLCITLGAKDLHWEGLTAAALPFVHVLLLLRTTAPTAAFFPIDCCGVCAHVIGWRRNV